LFRALLFCGIQRAALFPNHSGKSSAGGILDLPFLYGQTTETGPHQFPVRLGHTLSFEKSISTRFEELYCAGAHLDISAIWL
jgi:hypothetical protein